MRLPMLVIVCVYRNTKIRVTMIKLELNVRLEPKPVTTSGRPIHFHTGVRKKMADAIEQAAVNIRDGHAHGSIIVDDLTVGTWIITNKEAL